MPNFCGYFSKWPTYLTRQLPTRVRFISSMSTNELAVPVSRLPEGLSAVANRRRDDLDWVPRQHMRVSVTGLSIHSITHVQIPQYTWLST